MDLTEEQKNRMEVKRLQAIALRTSKSPNLSDSGNTMPLSTLFPEGILRMLTPSNAANAVLAPTTLTSVDSAYEPALPGYELPITPVTPNAATFETLLSTSASLPLPPAHHSQDSSARRVLEFPDESNQNGINEVLARGPSAPHSHRSRVGVLRSGNNAGAKRHLTGSCILINTLSSDERFKVDIGYHHQLKEIFKTMPSCEYVEKERRWFFSISDHDILMRDVKRLEDVTISPLPKSVLARYQADEEIENLISRLDPVLKNTLYPFQLEGIRFGIKKKGRVLIADDMGLGKTIQGIGIASIYQDEWPLLIVCPSSLKYTWMEAFLQWLPSLDPKTIQVVNSKEDDVEASDTRVFIMSYTMLVGKKDELIQKNIKVAILDESHFVKNRRSLRASAALEVLKEAARVILLSGTPALASPIDLYTQLHLIAPERFHSVSSYIRRYCYNHSGYSGRSRENGACNETELAEKLRKWLMIRRTKPEVLNSLPAKQRQKIVLNPRAMKAANPILERFNKIVESMTRQDAFTYFRETAEAKLPAVRKYVEDLVESGEKFLVFAHHLLVLEGIRKTLIRKKIEYIWINGSVDSQSRQELVTRFQEDPDCKVAVLSLTAACFGLTLTAAKRVVFAELFWNPGVLRQAEDRVHRISQDGAVLIQYLVAEDTMDDRIWELVNKKNDRIKRMGLTEDSFHNASTIEQEYSEDLDAILATLDDDDDDDEDIFDIPEDTAVCDETDGSESDADSLQLDGNFCPSSSSDDEDESSGTASEIELNSTSEVSVGEDNDSVDDNGSKSQSSNQSSDDADDIRGESGSEEDSDYMPVDEDKSSESAAGETRSRKSARLIDRKRKYGEEDDDEDNTANALIVRRKATGTSKTKGPRSKFQKLIKKRQKRLMSSPKCMSDSDEQSSADVSGSDDDDDDDDDDGEEEEEPSGNILKKPRVNIIQSDSDDTDMEQGGTRKISDPKVCNIHQVAGNDISTVLRKFQKPFKKRQKRFVSNPKCMSDSDEQSSDDDGDDDESDSDDTDMEQGGTGKSSDPKVCNIHQVAGNDISTVLHKFQKPLKKRQKRFVSNPKCMSDSDEQSSDDDGDDDESDSDDTDMERGGTRKSSDPKVCNIHEAAANDSTVLQSIVGNSMGSICRKGGNSENTYSRTLRKARTVRKLESDDDSDASVADAVNHQAKENCRNSKMTKKKQVPSVVRRCRRPRRLCSDDGDSSSGNDVKVLGTYNKKHDIPTIELSDDDCCSPDAARDRGRFC